MERVGWAAARATAFAAASALPTETVTVLECVGRTLTRDVRALQDVPHFVSSAMDGWAVAGRGPWQIVGEGGGRLEPGSATPVVTGGVIRPGVTAVVRSEHGVVGASIAGHELRMRDGLDPPPPGRDLRGAATEARAGDVLISAHIMLNPAHAAVAAASGHDTIGVAGRARVAMLTTGTEVISSGIPTPGFVRDSFGPMLPAAIAGMVGGARVVSRIRLGDDRQLLLEAVKDADADVIVTTGGTANSPVDHVRSMLDELGASLVVDGIAVRPGSPSLLARLPNGVFLVALPGNPLAAMVGAMLLLEPLLAALAGHPLPEPVQVVVGEDHEPGKVRMLPYRLIDGRAVASGWRDSGMLRGLADAHGVLVVPSEGVAAGVLAPTLPLPWAQTPRPGNFA